MNQCYIPHALPDIGLNDMYVPLFPQSLRSGTGGGDAMIRGMQILLVVMNQHTWLLPHYKRGLRKL